MIPDKRKTEFKFTYRWMVVGSLIGVLTYLVFKDVPSVLNVVKYGTWLAIVPLSILMMLIAPILRRNLPAATMSRMADIWLGSATFLVGHGFAFCTLCLARPF
jgi:amino acid transporter